MLISAELRYFGSLDYNYGATQYTPHPPRLFHRHLPVVRAPGVLSVEKFPDSKCAAPSCGVFLAELNDQSYYVLRINLQFLRLSNLITPVKWQYLRIGMCIGPAEWAP